MSKTPVAIQLFAVRGEVQKDLAATLRSITEIGYEGAEPWGYRGDALEWQGHSAADIRQMYDDAGIACCGFHLATDALLGDNLARTIEMNQILGNRFLIIAADKQRMSSLDTIRELADILNETAAKLKPHGMFTGYHAHPFDFEQIDGRQAWDILFSQTGEDVIMQMDIGNAMRGGGAPVYYLRKFPGRAKSVHLKEFGDAENAAIGDGEVNWDKVFEACDSLHPVEWYVVEQCPPEGIGFDVARRSLEALRAMGR